LSWLPQRAVGGVVVGPDAAHRGVAENEARRCVGSGEGGDEIELLGTPAREVALDPACGCALEMGVDTGAAEAKGLRHGVGSWASGSSRFWRTENTVISESV